MFTGIPATAQPGGRLVALALRVLVAAGVVAILVAWLQASASVEVSTQIDWAPVAVGGVAAVAAGLLASVLVARQAVAIRLSRLAPSIAEPASGAAAGFSGPEPPIVGHSGPEKLGADRARSRASLEGSATGSRMVVAEPLVAAGSMARFHRASCPLTVGKPVRSESRQVHEEAGRRRCGVCAP